MSGGRAQSVASSQAAPASQLIDFCHSLGLFLAYSAFIKAAALERSLGTRGAGWRVD